MSNHQSNLTLNIKVKLKIHTDEGLGEKVLAKEIEETQEVYLPQKTTSEPKPTPEKAAEYVSSQDKKQTPLTPLLQKFMQWEIKTLNGLSGTEDLLTHKLLQMNFEDWSDEESLKPILREIWAKLHHVPIEMVEDIGVDDEDILAGIENFLGDE